MKAIINGKNFSLSCQILYGIDCLDSVDIM